VYSVDGRSGADGVNVTVEPVLVTVPATATPPGAVSVKFAVVAVAVAIGSENVATTAVESATPVALLAGAVDTTVGAGNPMVVNVQLAGSASAAPSTSLIPVVSSALYSLLGRSGALGVNTMRLPSTNATVPATETLSAPVLPTRVLRVTFVVFTVAGSIDCEAGSISCEKSTENVVLNAWPEAPEVGVNSSTLGRGCVAKV
jgi:hypothetical protein